MRFFQKHLTSSFLSLINANDVYLYNCETLISSPHRGFVLSALLTCCGSDHINPDYLNRNYRNLMNERFDLIVFTRIPLLDNINLENVIKGFMIVEKGECSLHPDVFCVNLICSKGGGSVLLGLYLYCIYHTPELTSKIGLLELANAYLNVSGLCAYTKFGFEYDPTLFGTNCFEDFGNLPMKVDIAAKFGDQFNVKLQGILQNSARIVAKPAICEVTDPANQHLMGMAMNLAMFAEHNKTDYIVETALHDGTILRYDRLFDVFGTLDRLKAFIKVMPTLSSSDVALFYSLAVQAPQPPPLATPSNSPPLVPNPSVPYAPDAPTPPAPSVPSAPQTHGYNLRSRRRVRQEDEPPARSTRSRINGGKKRRHRVTRKRK